MKKARTLYSSEIVSRAEMVDGISVTHNYLNQEGGIPLPATYLLELSREIREKKTDMSVRLYSDYPFPWRREEAGPKNQFEWDALNYLKTNPEQSFFRVKTLDGISGLTLSIRRLRQHFRQLKPADEVGGDYYECEWTT
jgi:adenylate cyclase